MQMKNNFLINFFFLLINFLKHEIFNIEFLNK